MGLSASLALPLGELSSKMTERVPRNKLSSKMTERVSRNKLSSKMTERASRNNLSVEVFRLNKHTSVTKNNNLLPNARRLRKEMTPQERHLWYDFLRGYPEKFYKQRIIDNYIVDFYCAKAKLVIELDGSQHFTADGQEYDKIRTDILKTYGLSVMRFSNLDIDRSFPAVCNKIDAYVRGDTYDQL